MSVHRAAPEPEPVGGQAGTQEIRLRSRSTDVAVGTLACPACDAPVLLARALRPADPLACPLCPQTGVVRDFLSLATPTRPARVVVRISSRGPAVSRR